MFLPTTREEMDNLGWDALDVVLVTGDAYVDSPFVGVSVVGRVLARAGFRVGIIGQPDIHSERDITRLGKPGLFWGVTGGSIDSMVANYTATGKPKRDDDMTAGGRNDRRPDRAVIVYTNLIKQHFKGTGPIVLGGLEASLRRIAHYDYWSDSVRRSILFDAKADLLVYGMAERTVVALAERLRAGQGVEDLRGICYVAPQAPSGAVELPPYQDVASGDRAFIDMFHTFYANNDPLTARGLSQRQDTRYLIHNPPAFPLDQADLDALYELDFERDLHPFYARQGPVRALETIRFSLTTHRGCYGECNFCSITVHQGRTVTWRSEESVVREAEQLVAHPDFRGTILDVGGPTANMYGFECRRKLTHGACPDKRCIFPEICSGLRVDHSRQIALLKRLRRVPGVEHVFVGSGIRHDLVLADLEHGTEYLAQVVRHHTSGQMKVAPEHVDADVLRLMGKPGPEALLRFKTLFDRLTRAAGKEQYLTYYLIAAHPGCSEARMRALARFFEQRIGLVPEQVQIFTPLPSTYSALMYHTGIDPATGERIFVEKGLKGKERQKALLAEGNPAGRARNRPERDKGRRGARKQVTNRRGDKGGKR